MLMALNFQGWKMKKKGIKKLIERFGLEKNKKTIPSTLFVRLWGQSAFVVNCLPKRANQPLLLFMEHQFNCVLFWLTAVWQTCWLDYSRGKNLNGKWFHENSSRRLLTWYLSIYISKWVVSLSSIVYKLVCFLSLLMLTRHFS